MKLPRLMPIVFASVFVLSSAKATEAQQLPQTLYQEMRWRMIGPFRGGRTRAATGVPAQPNVFYVGQVNEGPEHRRFRRRDGPGRNDCVRAA